jgi:hypothetical protein
VAAVAEAPLRVQEVAVLTYVGLVLDTAHVALNPVGSSLEITVTTGVGVVAPGKLRMVEVLAAPLYESVAVGLDTVNVTGMVSSLPGGDPAARNPTEPL